MPPIVIIDDTGVHATSLDALRDRLSELMQTYVGQEVDLAPETPQGKLMTPFLILTHEQTEAFVALAGVLDAKTVSGSYADAMYSEWGVLRRLATRSTATVTLTGAEDTQVPAGTRIQSTAGDIFATDESALIPAAGTIDVDVTAAEGGPISVAINSLTVIVDGISGFTSVTNAAAGTTGTSRETTLDYVTRANDAIALNALGTPEAIKAHVADVDGVTAVELADNDTVDAFVASADRGLTTPAKAFEVIVAGGADDDVAEAILLSKSPGITAHGPVTVSIARPLGNTVTIGFRRPTTIAMSWSMTYTAEAGFPSDGEEQLEAAAVNYINGLGIGKWIVRNQFLKAILTVPGWDASTINTPTTTAGSNDVLDEGDLNIFDVLNLTAASITLTAT